MPESLPQRQHAPWWSLQDYQAIKTLIWVQSAVHMAGRGGVQLVTLLQQRVLYKNSFFAWLRRHFIRFLRAQARARQPIRLPEVTQEHRRKARARQLFIIISGVVDLRFWWSHVAINANSTRGQWAGELFPTCRTRGWCREKSAAPQARPMHFPLS